MDGGVVAKKFTLYFILPSPCEVLGNAICWALNPAIIELEVVFKGQLGLFTAKICADKLLHLWSYWLSLLKQAASSQTAKILVVVFFCVGMFLFPVVQLKIICSYFPAVSLHISEVNRYYHSQLGSCSSNWASQDFPKILIMAVSSHHAKELSAFSLGQSLSFSRQEQDQVAGMFLHHLLRCSTHPRQPVWSQGVTRSSPTAIYLQGWHELLQGHSSGRESLDCECATALAAQPCPGAAQPGDANLASLAPCHGHIPARGTQNRPSTWGIAQQRICPALFQSGSGMTRWGL